MIKKYRSPYSFKRKGTVSLAGEKFLSLCTCMYSFLRALMTRKSCAAGMRNAILRNHLKKERRLQNKSAFPTGLLDHVQWVDKNWRKINFRNSATLNLYPLTMVLMIKSEARMEFIQNSTFSLRKPTLNKEGSKAFSKSKASLG